MMNNTFFLRTLAPYMPLVWLILAAVLGAIEATTVQLVAIWFAVGSLSAIIPAALGGPLWVQLAVFTAVSTISMALTRKMAGQLMNRTKVSTNADSLIGQMGTVIQEIDNQKSRGRVMIAGLDWAATAEDGALIPAGQQVLVKRIEGVRLIVERIF